MKDRPDWDMFFMMKAIVTSFRSTCLNRKVGAVIVKDGVVASTGFNGPPSGIEHCKVCRRREEGFGPGEGLHKCMAAHSELNAISLAAKNGNSIDGATLYVTTQPCSECAKYIINSGIKRVVMAESYPGSESLVWFTKAGIDVIIIKKKIVLEYMKNNLELLGQ